MNGQLSETTICLICITIASACLAILVKAIAAWLKNKTDPTVITTERVFTFQVDGDEEYNKIRKFFDSNRDSVELVSMTRKAGFLDYRINIKYRPKVESFKLDF